MTTCTSCKQQLPPSAFSRDRSRKNGLQPHCKRCYHIYYESRQQEILDRCAVYVRAHPVQAAAAKHAWYLRNKQRMAEAYKAHYDANPKMYQKKQQQYRKTHRDKIRKYKRDWARKQRAANPSYRLRNAVSRAVTRALHKQGATKHRQSFFRAIGYTPKDLKAHLELRFQDGMSWSNYGSLWELDHIVPRVRFRYTSMHDAAFRACWGLHNLRPRLCSENRRDGGRLSHKHLLTYSSTGNL